MTDQRRVSDTLGQSRSHARPRCFLSVAFLGGRRSLRHGGAGCSARRAAAQRPGEARGGARLGPAPGARCRLGGGRSLCYTAAEDRNLGRMTWGCRPRCGVNRGVLGGTPERLAGRVGVAADAWPPGGLASLGARFPRSGPSARRRNRLTSQPCEVRAPAGDGPIGRPRAWGVDPAGGTMAGSWAQCQGFWIDADGRWCGVSWEKRRMLFQATMSGFCRHCMLTKVCERPLGKHGFIHSAQLCLGSTLEETYQELERLRRTEVRRGTWPWRMTQELILSTVLLPFAQPGCSVKPPRRVQRRVVARNGWKLDQPDVRPHACSRGSASDAAP